MGKEDITVTVYPIFHKDLNHYAISNTMTKSKRFDIIMKSKHSRLTRCSKHGTFTFVFDTIKDRDGYLSSVMHLCIDTSHELQIPATLEKKPDAFPGSGGTFNIYVKNIPMQTIGADVRALFPGHVNYYCVGGRGGCATLMFDKQSTAEKFMNMQPPLAIRGHVLKLYFENITNNTVYKDIKSYVPGYDEVTCRTLVVGNIPAGTREAQLEELFPKALFLQFHKNPDGSRKESASVYFSKEILVYKAIQHEPIKLGEHILVMRMPDETKPEEQGISQKVSLWTLVIHNIPPGTTEKRIRETFFESYCVEIHENPDRSNTGSASIGFPKEIHVDKYLQHIPILFGDNILQLQLPEGPKDNIPSVNGKGFLAYLSYKYRDAETVSKQRAKQRTDQRASTEMSRNTQQNRVPMVQRQRQTNPGNRPLNKKPLSKGPMRPGPRSILKGSTTTRNMPSVAGKIPPEKIQQNIDSFRQDNRPSDLGGVVLGSSGVQLPDGTTGEKLMAGCKRSSMGDNRSLNGNPGMQGNRPPNNNAKVPENQKANIPSLMSSMVAPVGNVASGNKSQNDLPLMPGNQVHTIDEPSRQESWVHEQNMPGRAENYGHRPAGAETRRDESNWSSQRPIAMEVESMPEQSDGDIQVFDYGHISQSREDQPPASKIPKDSENVDSSLNQSTTWDPENM